MGIEPGLAACKVSALYTVLSLGPHFCLYIGKDL